MPLRSDDRDAAETLALQALGHIAGDADLGPRFLDLTGLTVDTLRERAASAPVLAAALDFLAAHEPSLIAIATALDIRPEALIRARQVLA